MTEEIQLDDKMEVGKASVCRQRLINLGLTPEHAMIACSTLLVKDEKRASEMSMEECIKSRLVKIKANHPNISEEEQRSMAKQRCSGRADVEEESDNSNDFLLLFIDEEDDKPSSECISRKISIFHKEHGPESSDPWSHEKCVAAAHGWCRSHDIQDVEGVGEPIKMLGIVGGRLLKGRAAPAVNIPIKNLARLIANVKGGKSLKVGHAGIMPFLASLPMKNINRLQTALEKLSTAEAKNLTAEELTKRKAYAKQMKKDSVWMNDQIEIEKATVLNNVIKAPIILAKEMTQTYRFRKNDGSEVEEIHFKPYDELKKSIEDLEELPILIEHHESWEDSQIVGYVKDFIADDEHRLIRGTGYFNLAKTPTVVIDILKNKEPLGVSIGFMAILAESGLFNGILYDHAQRDIILEHLAICLDSRPRCPLGQCGVNIDSKIITDSQEFTIKNKTNYYYNIEDLLTKLDTQEETSLGINSKIINKSDSMTEDSLAKPKSGNISGDEPKDLATMTNRLRKFMAGIVEVTQRDMAKRKIREILQMTDEGEDETSETLEGEDMDQKEFEDTIAAKDAEVSKLQDSLKEMLISEIKRYADADKIKRLKLDEKCVHDLELIRDSVFAPEDISDSKVEVIPYVSPKEHQDEVKPKRYMDKIQELNAKVIEEFDLTGLEWIE